MLSNAVTWHLTTNFYNTTMYKINTLKLNILKIITCVMIVFSFIVSICAIFNVLYIKTYVNGLSMLPTLNSSLEQSGKRDIVYINRFGKVEVGDIVVLDLRDNPNFESYAIKRLIATENDIVNIEYDSENRQYNLLVNDKIVTSKEYVDFGYNTYDCFKRYIENYQQDSTRIVKENGTIKGVIIKKGEVFVLGDNWEVSKDSSLIGPVMAKNIVGRVDIIIEPNENSLIEILKGIF